MAVGAVRDAVVAGVVASARALVAARARVALAAALVGVVLGLVVPVPVAAAPGAPVSDGPPVGEVEGIEGTCRAVFTPAEGSPPGPLYAFGTGSVVLARCYTEPMPGTTLADAHAYAGEVASMWGSSASQTGLGCELNGETVPSQGRWGLTCAPITGPYVVDLGGPLATVQGVDVVGFGVTLGAGSYDPVDIYATTAAGAWVSHARVSELTALDPWPLWWPAGATPGVTPDTSGELPRVSCRTFQEQDLDGTPRARMSATVENPTTLATDTRAEWQFEWEITSGPLDDVSPGFDTAAAWATAPTHYGWTLLDVAPPVEGRPDRGWLVRVTTTRVYTGMVGVQLPRDTWQPTTVGTGGGTVYVPTEAAIRRLWQALGAVHPGDEGWLNTDAGRAEIMMYALQPATEPQYEFYPHAWSSAQVRCAAMLKGPGSGGVTIIDPGVPTDPGDPTGPTDPGDGLPTDGPTTTPTPGGCGGLSWNPLSIAETLACNIGDVLGPMLRWLGDKLGGLLQGVINAITGLLDGLLGLFVPDEWPDWGEVRDEAEGRAPLVHMEYLAGSASAFSSFVSGAGTECVDVGIEGYHTECISGAGELPGAGVVNALFILVLFVGAFTRMLRTAPWAKGRDGGEPDL